MKIPNKREIQQIALNQSSDIDFKDSIKFYKKWTAEPYSFLVNDATLASGNPLRFRKNLLKQMIEQPKFTYFPLGKAFEKQIKTIEGQGEKQIKVIQNQRQVKQLKNIFMVIKIVH